MHYDSELARDRDCGSLEADLLSELEAPGPERTVRRGAREYHDCRFIQQAAQMVVAAPGYMTIVIDFARLITPGCQSDPSFNRTRLRKVFRVLDRRHERRGSYRADAWNRGKQLALPRHA